MLFILFGTAAVAMILAAIALSNYAKALSRITSLDEMFMGTVLLASATTLPEVTTSLSAVSLGNPDIAFGNMLGSNMFNFLLIAVVDVWYRKVRLYQSVSSQHLYTAGLGLILSLMALLALVRQSNYVIFRFGVDALFIALVYGLGMCTISKIAKASPRIGPERAERESPDLPAEPSISLQKTTVGFFTMAFLITSMGTTLSLVSDEIIEVTGMGSSFMGSFFLAAATSMPEAITVLAALRLRNVNLALGFVLSSNILNILILIGLDAFYLDGPILSHVSPIHQVTAFWVSLLSLVLLWALRRREADGISYLFPSLIMLAGYFCFSYSLFNR